MAYQKSSKSSLLYIIQCLSSAAKIFLSNLSPNLNANLQYLNYSEKSLGTAIRDIKFINFEYKTCDSSSLYLLTRVI